MSVRKKLDGVLNVGDTITKALAAAKKKAKDAAEAAKQKIKDATKKKVDAKNNTVSILRSESPNQTKTSDIIKKTRRYRVGRAQAIVGTTAIAVPLTAAIMSEDKKLEKKANTAYSNDANTFTFNKKKYKTPTKAVLNKVASPKKESTPPEPPKSRPKVEDKKKQLMMKEKYSGKDSKVKFNAKGGMMKKYSMGGMTKKGKK